MAKRMDLTGQKFGMLTALAYDSAQNHKALWRCRCDCGKEIVARSDNIRNGTQFSCGCARRRNERNAEWRGRLSEAMKAKWASGAYDKTPQKANEPRQRFSLAALDDLARALNGWRS